jgi:hypothetical protein
MQNRPVDVKRGSGFQQFSGAGVASAQISMERSECCRLADAVPQTHQVNHRPGRVVYPDGLAGSCLEVRQTEFKGRGFEPDYHSRRERYPGRTAGSGYGDLDRGGISSVRSWTAAADRRQTIAVEFRYATARRSGKLAGGAPARRKTPYDSSTITPESRAAYRARGWIPRARAVSVVKVGGKSVIPGMDKSVARDSLPCDIFIQAALAATR